MLTIDVAIEKSFEEHELRSALAGLFAGRRVLAYREAIANPTPWEEVADVVFDVGRPRGEFRTLLTLYLFRFTQADSQRLAPALTGALARTLGCRTYCDGTGYGPDSTPYWGLIFMPDGACWLADDSNTDFGDGAGGPVRLVRQLHIETPPLPSL
jgi:hypothetical protein